MTTVATSVDGQELETDEQLKYLAGFLDMLVQIDLATKSTLQVNNTKS